MRVATCGFEAAPIMAPVDVVLSQSVLEHVFPLSATVAKLAQIQSPKTRFLHLVDFGNHYPTENPFEGLYVAPADAYIKKRGRAINCLRMSDVARLFEVTGVSATIVPTRVIETLKGPVHETWSARYGDEDLRTQLALVAHCA
jgi:hypothetical protein